MRRVHETVLSEGTFRVILTNQNRLIAEITAPRTAVGPLHIVLQVDRNIPRDLVLRHQAAMAQYHRNPSIAVGGIFDDIGRAIGRAAEGAFNGVSKVVTTVARPVFNMAKTVAATGMQLVAKAMPAKERARIEAAARMVMRARLGDMNARQFITQLKRAAKAGAKAARAGLDALASGARLVARTVDPGQFLKHIPGIGGTLASLSPFKKFDQVMSTIQRGDMKALKNILKEDLANVQGVLSMIPGIGTGINVGLSAGMAVLSGGSPLEIAIRAAYGAIPIPPGLRQVTDAALATVFTLVENGNVTDVGVAVAREKIPAGLPRDIFDTLIQLVVKRVPIKKVGGDLANHYLNRFGGQAAQKIASFRVAGENDYERQMIVGAYDDVIVGTFDDGPVAVGADDGLDLYAVGAVGDLAADEGRMILPFHMLPAGA